ncbi:MAG: YihY/virulence factor BrkB family protein [Blastocatellia bacterium]|nr:YihY/virulence factor BrkB family protein [Blastocatellia bacterium]
MKDQENNGYAKYPDKKSWRVIARQTWDKLFDDEIFGRCAQFAYYWFFSLFPLLILLTALLAYLPLLQSNLDRWLDALSEILPPDAYSLVRSTFHGIIRQRRHGLLSFSILAVIWASSSGMGVLISSLNKSFDSAKSRPWWRERLLAIILTLGLTTLIIAALMLIFFGDYISQIVANAYGFGSGLAFVWHVGQWLVVIAFVLIGVELLYYFAPNVKQRWAPLTPGAIFALVFWLSISYGLRLYVSLIVNYSATYGALGSVMVLMSWLYLMGMAILVGGVINSVVRRV